jgi:hypothetical protein
MGEHEVKMLQQVIKEMNNRSTNTDDTVSKLVQQFQGVGQYLGHLEQGVFAIARELNIVKKTNEMILNMFVESGVYSQEDINEKFQIEVINPILKIEQDRRMKLEEMMKQHAQEEEIQQVAESIEVIEEDGTAVLASERNNVIVFGRKEEEQ